MKLRKYSNNDAEIIVKWIKNERELRLWSADRYNNYPITSNDINNNYDECQKNSRFYPLTLTDSDNVVGHLILRNINDDLTHFRLGFIIINPDIRKKGYGRKLILSAIKYAKRELGAKSFDLYVFMNNENAINCYKSVGFTIEKINYDTYKFYNESWDGGHMVYKENDINNLN